MTRLVLLHSNDVHGNVEGLARIATLVERIRAESDCPVVYVDAGDVEESTTRISNVTKGAAMHRLLSAAGCAAAAVGNASWLSYGPQVLAEHAREASYPLLLANLRLRDGSPIPGTQDSALVELDGVRLGLIGVTDPFLGHDFEDFGVAHLDEAPVVRRLAAELRERGADFVVVLSHLGLENPRGEQDDRWLAPQVAGHVDLIVGGHSHDLLPEGERIVAGVPIAQTGAIAENLGRVELRPDGVVASLVPVTEDVPPHPAVLAAAASVEPEIEALLDEVIGELPEPLDPERAALWLAGVIRERMAVDVAILTPGQAFTRPLPAGPLRRGTLWDACDSRANPGVVTMTREQLETVLERGRDAEFARSTARPLRGRERGVLQVSGEADGGEVRVAGTDWELEPYGGLVEEEWDLRARYDFPTIVREAIEEHLRRGA